MRYRDKWPTYARQWDKMEVKPSRMAEFAGLARFAIKYKDGYKAIEKATGVPWPLIAVLHRRESDADFSTYLGNGEPLNRRTRLVPKGRGPFRSFEEGAIDALHYDGLDKVKDWRLEKMLWHAEKYNGLGYEKRGKSSPYLWGGSNQQQAGKYVADGRWSSTAWDRQPGVAPLLDYIQRLDPSVKYERED